MRCCVTLGAHPDLPGTNQISTSLLQSFAKMASTTQDTAIQGQVSDLRIYCAFSFPGVAQALGPDRWHEIAPLFRTLTVDVQRRVRRTLAYSLHEVG